MLGLKLIKALLVISKRIQSALVKVTGDIHAIRSLDREEKPFYTLRAQAVDIETRKPLEPESEFIIKVQDINDNEPKFLDGPYVASVPEMSPVGE